MPNPPRRLTLRFFEIKGWNKTDFQNLEKRLNPSKPFNIRKTLESNLGIEVHIDRQYPDRFLDNATFLVLGIMTEVARTSSSKGSSDLYKEYIKNNQTLPPEVIRSSITASTKIALSPGYETLDT